MSNMQTIIENFMDRVWVCDTATAVAEFLHPDSEIFGLEETALEGVEDFMRFHRMVMAQFTNVQFNTMQSFENDDWLALLGVIEATDIQTGRKGKARIQIMARFKDGQVIEAHNLVDYVTFFESMGRLPQRTLDMCLLDNRVMAQSLRA